MIVVTYDEQEELVEHFEERPDIWLLHNGVWVRLLAQQDADDREYALAIRISPHVERELYALVVKPVAYTPVGAEQYTRWLLERYTSYGERVKVIDVLKRHSAASRASIDRDLGLHHLSRDLCALRQGTFTRRRKRAGKAFSASRTSSVDEPVSTGSAHG